MKLIFEKSAPGRGTSYLPACDVPAAEPAESLARKTAPELPELAEPDVDRHFAALARRTFGVCDGFYPLGSCTMKYNPKINEWAASLPGFAALHPLVPDKDAQGALELMYKTAEALCEITGQSAATLQPAAGAHGEFTGLLTIKAFHEARGDTARTKIIVPDSAHGTNPASATMAGFSIVNIASYPDGTVDLEALKAAVGPDTAGLMLTNPNTLGVFEKNIPEITRIVHEAGGLCYYDGANLNAIMGAARPGDMGFDVVHVNLHKTFSTPHGGGGPGSGPVCCSNRLAAYLPGPVVVKMADGYELQTPEHSIGRVRSFNGNFAVVVRAYAYIRSLGGEGLREASENAVLNANYLKKKLEGAFDAATEGLCMHEFVLTLERQRKEYGVSALDVAKMLADAGLHPPTMYFPLIVHEALMAEPTETESKSTLDEAADAMIAALRKAEADPAAAHAAPVRAQIRRPDEVRAARNPILRYKK